MAQFICSECGNGTSSWYGKCPECGSWNTLKENRLESKSKGIEDIKKVSFTPITTLKSQHQIRIKTGIYEFDRVIGGGFMPGEVILLAGEPGVGKSTILLTAISQIKALYVSGEESAEQVRGRTERMKLSGAQMSFSAEPQIDGVLAELEKNIANYDVFIIDSIQTVYSKDSKKASGSGSQIKEVAGKLIEFAKKNHIALLIVGHVTKDGDIAGPKMLEHMVDCVLYFEGEKGSPFRILRCYKNRFGSTDEVGVFEMKGSGLAELTNPLAFIEADDVMAPGRAVVGIAEGSRVLFFEVQCLVVPTSLAMPRRVVSGFDNNKVQLLLAVIRKNLKLPLDKFDIYINIVGGVSIKSTAADLGIIASVISSFKNIPLPQKSVFIGEVGLLGEIRKLFTEDKIIKEAKRYGFTSIYSSQMVKKIIDLPNLIIK